MKCGEVSVVIVACLMVLRRSWLPWGAKVVCSRQDFQRSGQDHVGMVAGRSKGFVGACSVCVVDGAEGTV